MRRSNNPTHPAHSHKSTTGESGRRGSCAGARARRNSRRAARVRVSDDCLLSGSLWSTPQLKTPKGETDMARAPASAMQAIGTPTALHGRTSAAPSTAAAKKTTSTKSLRAAGIAAVATTQKKAAAAKQPSSKRTAPPPEAKKNPRQVGIADQLGGETLRAHFYQAQKKPVIGLAVLAPGSRGGMGPGQTPATIGQFRPSVPSVYPVVARRLAEQGIACIHLTWRLNPTRKGAPPGTLKSPTQLMLGVEDISLAARYLRAQHGARGVQLPLVLVGFSFGGPAVMATGALAVADGGEEAGGMGRGVRPLHGVVTMGCGMRVSKQGSAAFQATGLRLVGGSSKAKPHDYHGLDSESCVDALARAGTPLAMIHGLADVTVDPTASQTIFARAPGPKAALWLEGADHQARTRFDDIVATLLNWLPALVARPLPHLSAAPDGAALGSAPPLPQPESLPRVDDQGSLESAAESARTQGSADVNDEDADEDRDEQAEDLSSELASEVDELSSSDDMTTARTVGSVGSALRGLDLNPPSHAASVIPPVARPDAHCPFLDGEACTI